MDIKMQTADRNLLLELSGELDHHAAKNAIRDLELAVDAALPRRLLLDFGGVTFMDSSGIALLLRAKRCMDALDGSMQVCHVPPQAKRVMDAAGIGRLIHIKQEGTV
ncbi:STAS domain-containing protein [Oscillibacter sp.]|uniref:STAS domain-containing protein n=1 Tax=Oscillibacter sp. TaxID=1945593 RepID=UPI00289A5DEA|nr:STAS domain-containing protein [Oscillibacter sp.]